jgi:hypothetical protein
MRSAGEPSLSLIQPKAVITNHSPENAFYFDAEVLSLVIQGKANAMAERIGGPVYLPPLGTKNFILPMVQDVEDGHAEGRIHFRIKYGKSVNSLSVTDEYKFRIKADIIADNSQDPVLISNFFLEDYISR